MNEKQKIRKQQAKQNNRQIRFYYSFLTLVLLVCLIQVVRSAVLNIIKTANYKVKVRKMMVLREEVQSQHDRLESDIKNFGNLKSLEAIARNNLKMAAKMKFWLLLIRKRKKPKQMNRTFPKQVKIPGQKTPKR